MSIHSYLFCSRNKDNQNVEGFVCRRMTFLSHHEPRELMPMFEEFVAKGLPGEMSRFYVSVNARDEKKIRKELACRMITDDNINIAHLDGIAVSVADKKENAAENRWLFDYDDTDDICAFTDAVIAYSGLGPADVEVHPTPNGYAVITSHGFDTRRLLQDFPCATLKRDDKLCFTWKKNDDK